MATAISRASLTIFIVSPTYSHSDAGFRVQGQVFKFTSFIENARPPLTPLRL